MEKPIYAVVGNKNDLYMEQQVDILDAKDFTKNIGGIFQLTSAKTSDGISVLFDNIGKKIIKPSYQYDEIDNTAKENYIKKKEEEERNKKNRIKLNNNNINNDNGINKNNNQTNQVDTNKNKKNGCC